jgi:hypothetical protein
MPPQESRSSAPQLKVYQFSQNLVITNNMKFPDTVITDFVGVVISKTILSTLWHIMFRLLPMNYQDINKLSIKLIFV